MPGYNEKSYQRFALYYFMTSFQSKIDKGMKENSGNNEKIINLWSKGIKSNYYHLLPAKGIAQTINILFKAFFEDISKVPFLPLYY